MSSRPVLVLVAAAVLAASSTANAQANMAGRAEPPAPAPGTPAACTKAAVDWRNAQTAPALAEYRNATEAERPEALKKYSAFVTATAQAGFKMAADCATQFDLETIAATQLTDLITLYNSARDTTNARRATQRLLTG